MHPRLAKTIYFLVTFFSRPSTRTSETRALVKVDQRHVVHRFNPGGQESDHCAKRDNSLFELTNPSSESSYFNSRYQGLKMKVQTSLVVTLAAQALASPGLANNGDKSRPLVSSKALQNEIKTDK